MNRLPMARAAREAGFEVHVATRVDRGAKAIEAEGFILHRMPFRRGGLSPLATIPAIMALRRLENEIRPQIVHHVGLQCCVFGSVAALGEKIPLVNAITGLGYIFTSITWRTRFLKRIIAMLLPRLLNGRHSVVLVQNPDDRAALVALGVEPERTVLIPGSGVDADALQPLAEPDGPITMGFAGRLLADKGIRELIAAHGILRNQGHHINLIIAGNPDPANPASIAIEEVEQWSRRPGITWLGHIDDIVSLWRRCHFAVLPSHREGLPMSLLEAAACGRAMIATDAPGCREIVIDDKTGLLVPVENSAALAEAILRLAVSPQLRARYGKAARQLVVDRLSARVVGKAISELYDRSSRESCSRTRQPNALLSPAAHPPRAGKILLVTPYYAPSPNTTSGYMTDIARELAQERRVTVLSSSPDSATGCPWTPGEPEVIEIASWRPGKSALVSRSLAAVFHSLQFFWVVMKHARSEDVVLCVNVPLTLPYAVVMAARLRKAASVLIIYDFHPDSLVTAGLLRPSSVVIRILRWANKMMFRWLASIVVIGRDMSSKLLEYPQMSEAKISFIPNWATLAIGYRELAPDNSYRRRCGGQFLVAMSGNAGLTHDPESVFEAARILKDDKNIRFLLSGEGVGWTRIGEMQAASPLDNVTLIERVAESQLEELLSAADIWVIPYRKYNTGVSVPSRIYNLFAVGRPVIICSEPDAEAAMLVRENDIGWVVPPESPHEIAQAITLAASAAADTSEKGRRAATVGLRYSRGIALKAYRDLMNKLLERQSLKH